LTALFLLWGAASLAAGLPYKPLFSHLTAEDGLSNAWVRSILQDSTGYLWVATANGLNRYDGYTFTQYRHLQEDPTSLGQNSVNAVFEDSEQRLWIGTAAGLSRYDPACDCFTNFSLHPSAEGQPLVNNVQSIVEGHDGLLWMSTVTGVSAFDPTSEQFTHYVYQEPDPSGPGAFSLFGDLVIDGRGIIWVGSMAYGLARFDPRTASFSGVDLAGMRAGYFNDTRVMALDLRSPGELYVGVRGGGLYLLDITTDIPSIIKHYTHDPTDPTSLSNDLVMALLVDAEGDLLIGTENGGLDLLAAGSTEFAHNTNEPGNPGSINNDSVYCLFEDRADNLWVGTFAGGINTNFVTRQAIRLYRAAGGGLSYNAVTSFLPDDKGNLWIGTDGGGLNYFDRWHNAFVSYTTRNSNLNRDAVLALSWAPGGELWLSTWDGGISRFDLSHQRFETYTTEQGLPGNDVLDLYCDPQGRIWAACYFAGLAVLEPDTGLIHRLGEAEVGISTVSVRTLVKLRGSKLLIGTDVGFSIFDLDDGSFQIFDTSSGNPRSVGNTLVHAAYDAGKLLWIGTGNGLARLDTASGRFAWFREAEGLPNSTINGIVADQDKLWLSSDRGIARFDPASEKTTVYTIEDGLQGNQYYPRSYGKTKEGEILFGGTNGFNIIRPQLLKTNEQIPPVVLTGFAIFNQPVALGPDSPLQAPIAVTHELSLSYRDSVFTLEFAALDFTAPAQNHYAYQMVGFDADWVFCGSQRSVTYTNLAPGEYTFRVKASNNDGIWNEQGASVRIIITPPLYKTGWFRTLAVLSILALTVAAHRLRLVAVKRKNDELEAYVRERTAALKTANQELEAFSYSVSHDLRAPLRAINGFITALEDEYKNHLDEQGLSYITRVKNASRRMGELIDALLNLSRLMRVGLKREQTDLTALAGSIVDELKHREPDREVSVNLQPGLVAYCDPTLIRIVLENLMGNAIKFTAGCPGAHIELGTRADDSPTVFYIRDNGVGFDMEYANKLFRPFQRLHGGAEYLGTGIGLATAQRIIERHGGRIWASAVVDEGATFFFTLEPGETASRASDLPRV